MIHLNQLVLLFNQISHKSASICINKILLYTQSFNMFLLLERLFMFHWPCYPSNIMLRKYTC